MADPYTPPPLPPGAYKVPPLPAGADAGGAPSGQPAPSGQAATNVPSMTEDPIGNLRAFTQQVSNEGGLWGPVDRFGLGVVQGYALDPYEALTNPYNTGLDDPNSILGNIRRGTEKSYTGEAGRIVGAMANPVGRAIGVAGSGMLPNLVGRVGPKFASVATHLGEQALRGAAGSVLSPISKSVNNIGDYIDAEWEKAKTGGIVGGALGVPGTIARAFSYPTVQAAVKRALTAVPFINTLAHANNLSTANFNRVWYKYALEPIGGKVPPNASAADLKAVGDQIGTAIENATKGMSYDTGSPVASYALTAARDAAHNDLLLSSPDTATAFSDTFNRLVARPLAANPGGKLDSERFQSVVSNLKSEIDRLGNMGEQTENTRALRRQLENIRMTLFDNATATPEQHLAYQNARTAWARYATQRDAIPLGTSDGLATPDLMKIEVDRRGRFTYGRGQENAGEMAASGQQALFASARAAERARDKPGWFGTTRRGQPLRQPEELSGVAGQVATQQPQRHFLEQQASEIYHSIFGGAPRRPSVYQPPTQPTQIPGQPPNAGTGP